MGSALAKAVFCGVAGALAWLICEPFFPKTILPGGDQQWLALEIRFFFLTGALIGVAAGVFNGLKRGGLTNVMISGGLGLVFGAMGAGFGHTIAGLIYVALHGGLGSPTSMIARTLALSAAGLLLGAAVGASQRSARGLVSGAVGGVIAGFVTGALFDPVAFALQAMTTAAQAGEKAGTIIETGAPSRALMSFGLGTLIGLFTSLVDLATRRAWLRLLVGRNEGREWPIDSGQVTIGRDERAHVPVFTDPQVPPLAAVITRQNGQYVLSDPGSPIGVGHNGIRVLQAVLSNGDMIQVGSLNFQFLMKEGAAQRAEGRAQPLPVMPQQQPVIAGHSSPTQAFPASATAPLVMTVTNGPMTGQRFSVTQPLEIGREGSGISLSVDSQASRKHAMAEPVSGGLQIRDLGSTNGTFVNNVRIQVSIAKPGDTVTIGGTMFRID